MDARFRQSNMFPELALGTHLSAQECLELLESAPPHYRTIIERVWECKDEHFKTTRAPFDLAQLESRLRRYHDRPASVPSYSRARRKYPQLVWMPILRNQERPWASAMPIDGEPVTLKPEDQIRAGQLTLGEHGTVLLDGRPLVAVDGYVRVAERFVQLAAGLSALIALDGMDGHFDHVIHWCVLLVHAMHSTIY